MIRYLALALLSGGAFAVSEEELTRSVLTHFPLIEQAELKYEASRGEVEAAQGAFDHKLTFKSRNRIEDKYENQYFESTIERQTRYSGLSLVAGHRSGQGVFPAYDGKYKTSSAGEIFAGIALPVLRNFQSDEFRLNVELAKLRKGIAKAEVELKQNIYIHKALSLYYKWLFANQKLKIRESILKIAEERQGMLEKKYAAGDIDRLKLTDNQRSIDKRRDELAKARIEWQSARTQLELYYRDDAGQPITLGQDVLPQDDVRPVSPTILTADVLPQLRMIDSEIRMRESERKFFDQSRLPGLNLEVIGSRELSGNVPWDPSTLQLGVKFDLPLENRKAEGKTTASEYKFRALVKEKDFMVQQLKQQLNYSYDALLATRGRWEVTSSEFEKSMRIAEAERSRWTQGASDLFILALREQDAADVDVKRWSVWYEYHQLLIDTRLFSGKMVPR
jgi:outer membrane protein TolC